MKPWKVQKFFGDLIYDLRSRGLLPLTVLLLVAMVVVPSYVASQGSDDGPGPPIAVESAAELAPENQAAVVAYEPGVRNYKQRLEDQSETDPFIQQFPVSPQATEALDAASSEPASGGADPGPVDSGGTKKKKPSKSGKTVTRYYSYETDVLVGPVGAPLKRRNRVSSFDYLPSLDAPVLSFMGTINGGKQAVFLVSEDVTAHTGAGRCFPAPESCQLLALAPGEAEDLTYGEAGQVFRIKVVKIKLKVSTKPPRD